MYCKNFKTLALLDIGPKAFTKSDFHQLNDGRSENHDYIACPFIL